MNKSDEVEVKKVNRCYNGNPLDFIWHLSIAFQFLFYLGSGLMVKVTSEN